MALANPSVATSFSHAASKEKIRKSVVFPPSVWGNHFISLSQDQKKIEAWSARAGELKEEVRVMLKDVKGSEKEMELIDNLQRLGLTYHFQKEIEDALKLMNYNASLSFDTDSDLHSIALRFRLLRQQGYRVHSDVFNKFKDQTGRFKENITSDPKGMLSLYEAAFLGTHGETILDEALAFTKKQLHLAMEHLEPPLAGLVGHALELPLRRRMHRLESRDYISLYEMQEGQSNKLLELAKLEYNLLQTLHQKEMREISRWWKEVNHEGKLKFARDRVVECSFWPMGVFHEPKYSRARVHATKLIQLASVLDDIYDAFGTLDELQLFTDAIQKWDLAATEHLPDYMKVCYTALLGCSKAMEEDLAPPGNTGRVHYLIEAMKSLCKAYLAEASWCNQGYTPALEEYLTRSSISSGYPMVINLCLVGMGDEVPKETFTWLTSRPKLVDSTSRLCRLVDDITSNGFEQERGHVASAVQSYMKEHPGCSEEEACKKLREIVEVHWKDINEECLEPAPVPVPLLQRILNLSRVMEMLYQHGDGYTFSNTYTKERIEAMFVNAIPI
ncbi:hypothetical protein H6P81_015642 [Aristolochia fimbriata]|uniref:Uncharacterized protein n=1 Tax=Aristolochia fimbriata TaxID=158543 RepID=A0AAV7E992_ARIFI|nr:hypothetical protein H6P81_015642 [Aristolochia fimbriata]